MEMFAINARSRASVCAILLGLGLSAAPAIADELEFHFNVDLSGMPVGGFVGGETFPYSVFVSIVDTESNGFDSQGLHGFTFDILTNTGIMQPALEFSPTSMLYSYITIIDNVWLGGMTPSLQGGFGMGFITDTGNNVTSVGDVLGPGAAMGFAWDADVDNNAGNGLQPTALHGIGIGSPPGTDVGGNTVPPAGARDAWYLMQGEINVPLTPGVYNVSVDPQAVSLISSSANLTVDIPSGWLAPGSPVLNGDSFEFTVVPEPASMSVLLLAGAAMTWRRSR
jgi:hypothetical protein